MKLKDKCIISETVTQLAYKMLSDNRAANNQLNPLPLLKWASLFPKPTANCHCHPLPKAAPWGARLGTARAGDICLTPFARMRFQHAKWDKNRAKQAACTLFKENGGKF